MRYAIGYVVLFMVLVSNRAEADIYRSYDRDYAKNYALANYDTAYGGATGNPFYNYDYLAGGNCTNFASQVLMAGLYRSTSMSTVFGARYEFDIDAGGGAYQWYWRSDADRGPAFTGANKLYEYAVHNQSSYKGLHFTYVTHDTTTTFMDYNAVMEGDIIFADWEHDGTIDHSMIVTKKTSFPFDSGYNKIHVTYQGTGTSAVGVTDAKLGDINEGHNYQAVFYVYRPANYNPSGN